MQQFPYQTADEQPTVFTNGSNAVLNTAESAQTDAQQPQPKICPRCGGTKKVPGPFGGPATFTCVDCDTSVIRSGVR
jgi:hypothetical protein